MNAKVAVLMPDDTRLGTFEGVAPDGIEMYWVDSTQSLEKQAALLTDSLVVIAVPQLFPVELARLCPNLRLVQTVSAGVDMIDIPALGELGVRVANNGGGNAVAVAEHSIALILAVYRKLHLQFQSVKERKWAGAIGSGWRSSAHELTGKTVGILGLGRIGREVARRLQGWECDLVYHDFIDPPEELIGELHVTRLTKDELLRSSDIVTLHVPLNKMTEGMISHREFALMKPEAVLINTCRGPVVDEAAMIESLQDGKIAGAGLDVLEDEPTRDDNPLLDMDNVVITPHLASLSQESKTKSVAFAMENVGRVLRGEEPESVVLPV